MYYFARFSFKMVFLMDLYILMLLIMFNYVSLRSYFRVVMSAIFCDWYLELSLDCDYVSSCTTFINETTI